MGLATLVAPLAGRLGGTSARMAVAGIASGLSRTGIAIVALAVALSATIGISVMVDSFRGSVNAWLQQTLQADIYTGTIREGSMQPDLIAAIRNIDGVIDMSTRKRATVEDATGRTQLRVFELPPQSYVGAELLDAEPGVAWAAWEAEDAVFVSEPYAYERGVGAGDVITLPTDLGDREFAVAATFQSYDINARGIMMSRKTYARHFRDNTVDSLGLYLDDSVDVDAVIREVEQLFLDMIAAATISIYIENQYFTSRMPERTSMRSNSGTSSHPTSSDGSSRVDF